MCEDDPVVARVRSARKQISKECGNDPRKLLAWAKKIEAKYADRIQNYEQKSRRKTG